MTDEARTSAKPSATENAREQRTLRGPLFRFACLALFVMTLPFTWGETASCNGPRKTFTGLEQATSNPGNAISLGFIFITPVLLGFVQYYVRPTGIRAMSELISTMLSGLGTFFCFIATVFQGDITHKSSRFYFAPLIATIAAFMMTVHAFRGAILRVAEMVKTRRKDNRGG